MIRLLSALLLMPFVLGAVIYGGPPFLVMVGIAIGLSFKEWGALAVTGKFPVPFGVLGYGYILACCLSFAYLRQHYPDGAGLSLCLILGIWASDTGAYFAGKNIGGPKLAPHISPNKTWAGLLGGMAGSALSFVVYAACVAPFLSHLTSFDLDVFDGWTLWVVGAIGASVTLTGQAGDLIESYAKRKAGVKDSGTLIPGHGGILDRIDSLLLAAPLFLVTLMVLA